MNQVQGKTNSPDDKDRLLAAACHGSILFFGFVGPLGIWLAKRDSPLVDKNGREALNFCISIFAYAMVCLLLSLLIIGIFMLYGLMFLSVVLIIIATVRIYSGVSYRYPFIFRLIKKT